MRAALDGERAYLVGGAVRDLLLGATHPDLDVAVDGDVARGRAPPRARTPSRTSASPPRPSSSTACGSTSPRPGPRAYPLPGALPEVEPAPLERDLARRDFTVNAMAVPLAGAPRAHRPPRRPRRPARRAPQRASSRVVRGRPDARPSRRPLRRAPRLRARAGDRAAGRRPDLGTVSERPREAELRRIAAEETRRRRSPCSRDGALRRSTPAPARASRRLARSSPGPEWAESSSRRRALLHRGPEPRAGGGGAPALLRAPQEPLRGRRPRPRALARWSSRPPDWPAPIGSTTTCATGGTWSSRSTATDLIAAGVPEGPAVGRGLAAALDAKLDGEAANRDEELRVALAAAS